MSADKVIVWTEDGQSFIYKLPARYSTMKALLVWFFEMNTWEILNKHCVSLACTMLQDHMEVMETIIS